jgi:apolipoprotein N-acyltransferase
MYYFQIGISIVFIIGLFASLAYLLYLSVKVSTRLIGRKEAMRKSFLISFFTWMAMFTVYLIWQDISHWNFGTWLMVIIFIFGFSAFGASIFALALWNWKNKT